MGYVVAYNNQYVLITPSSRRAALLYWELKKVALKLGDSCYIMDAVTGEILEQVEECYEEE